MEIAAKNTEPFPRYEALTSKLPKPYRSEEEVAFGI